MKRLNLCIKRAFDIVSSGIAIILFLPLWIGVAIAIKKDSAGPVFFMQERRTQNGKVFRMLKFRTMVVHAETLGTGLFSYENDPRVTKVGRKLRDSSVDELPQLFNIFKGDMSVVGPRPCVTYELGDFDTLNSKYKKRCQVKSGLTGLAQVKGRNGISWDEKVDYDNQYVDCFNRFGVLIDIKILLESVIKVSLKENIYESKKNSSIDDEAAAEAENLRIIRLAHLPDDCSGMGD